MTCDYCGEPIEDGEDYYELPNHDNIHLDCLSDWAEQYILCNDPETWGIRP